MRIAVYDSGIGGLTTLAKLITAYPDCDYLYFADNASFPFGQKDVKSLKANLTKNIERLKAETDAQVIACYTASSLLQKTAGLFTLSPKIKDEKTLLIATPNTLKTLKPKCLTADTPCLAYIIQTTLLSGEDIKTVDNYLFDTLSDFMKIETVSIGCTHYNFVKKNIKAILGASEILDGSDELVKNLESIVVPSSHSGRLTFQFSGKDDTEIYVRLTKRLLSKEFG